MTKKSTLTVIIPNPVAVMVPIYAAVDVGSNNVRMDLYGLTAEGHLKKINIVEQTLFPCKLAEGMDVDYPLIKKERLESALGAMHAFDAILRHYHIKPENICTVMTAAIRAVEPTDEGQKAITRLGEAYGHRPFTVVSGEEEARLVGEAIKLACPPAHRKHNGKTRSMAFAAIGGGSVEIGAITADGRVIDAAAPPYGIHTLSNASHGKITKAGHLFNHILRENYPRRRHDILCVIGGNWRALGEAVCGELPATLKGKEIQKRLISATRRKKKYYEKCGGRPAERAAFMPISAAILRRVANHFDAKKVVFLKTTIRDAMVDLLHRRSLGEATPPGLERLFSPLDPAPAPHA